MVLFANYQTFVTKDEKGKTKVSGNRRVMYTVHNACWDAKNRDDLPEMCDFDYQVIKPLIEKAIAEPVDNTSKEEPTAEPIGAETYSPSVSAIDFESDEYKKLPSQLVDLMKQNEISIERMMDAVFAKGIFPKDTPIENIPSDFWSYLISTWNEFLGALVENEMQF